MEFRYSLPAIPHSPRADARAGMTAYYDMNRSIFCSRAILPP
jgi:hypothetical protein